jgi:hypothetical protein
LSRRRESEGKQESEAERPPSGKGQKATVRKSAAKKASGSKAVSQGVAASKRKASKVSGAGKAGKKSAAAGKLPSRQGEGEAPVGAGDGHVAETADPFEIAKQRMKGSVPAIVEAMVELAIQGSCTHAKTLLEMTGAKHMFGSEAETQDAGESWAKLVLERMEQAENEGTQEQARETATEH